MTPAQPFRNTYLLRLSLPFFITLLVSVQALLIQKTWPLLLWTLVLTFLCIDLPKSLGAIPVIRASITLFAVLSALQVESLVFWVLRVHANPFLYSFTALSIALGLTYASLIKEKRFFVADRFRFSRADIIILLPALIVAGAVWGRVILPQKSDDVSIVQSIAFGLDDSTHLRFFGDLIRSDDDMRVHPEEGVSLTYRGEVGYPLGWHISTAVAWSSFHDFESKPLIEEVRAYFLAKLATLITLVLVLAIFTYRLAQRITFMLDSIIRQLAFIFTIVAVSIIIVMPVYLEGFFSLLPVLSFLLLFATVMLEDEAFSATTEILLGLLVAASALTWLLTAPALLVTLVAIIVHQRGSVRNFSAASYLAMSLGILAILSQVYILAFAGQSIQNIASSGGTPFPSNWLLYITLAAFVFFYVRHEQSSSLKNGLAFLILPLALTLLTILIFMSMRTQPITYYYFKLQTTLLIVLLPFSLILITKLIFESQKPTLANQLVSILLILAVFGLSIPSVIGYDYFSNIVSGFTSRTRFDLANTPEGKSFPDEDSERLVSEALGRPFSADNSRILFFYSKQHIRTAIASNIARSSFVSITSELKVPCDDPIFHRDLDQGDTVKLSEDLQRCAKILPPVFIYTDSEGLRLLDRSLPKELVDNKEVTVIATE